MSTVLPSRGEPATRGSAPRWFTAAIVSASRSPTAAARLPTISAACRASKSSPPTISTASPASSARKTPRCRHQMARWRQVRRVRQRRSCSRRYITICEFSGSSWSIIPAPASPSFLSQPARTSGWLSTASVTSTTSPWSKRPMWLTISSAAQPQLPRCAGGSRARPNGR